MIADLKIGSGAEKKNLPKIRLFIAAEQLVTSQQIKISSGDFEYLTKVMRQKIGNFIRIFNGHDGEFLAQINAIDKKSLTIDIGAKIIELKRVPNLTLAFALVKNVRIDFLAAKATELGVANFQPLISDHSVVDKLNFERFFANVKEACEQCGRNDFPQILPLRKLEEITVKASAINGSKQKIFVFCDESGNGESAKILLPKIATNYAIDLASATHELVVIIGPEGGFSNKEFEKFRQIKDCFAMSLGPRIMRADTAIIAALTLVQEFLGDFSNFRKNEF